VSQQPAEKAANATPNKLAPNLDQPARRRRALIAMLRKNFGDTLTRDCIAEYMHYIESIPEAWNQECRKVGFAKGKEPSVPVRQTFTNAIDDYRMNPDNY
jgi:hypothetical protein